MSQINVLTIPLYCWFNFRPKIPTVFSRSINRRASNRRFALPKSSLSSSSLLAKQLATIALGENPETVLLFGYGLGERFDPV
jgi:hypothetical protein